MAKRSTVETNINLKDLFLPELHDDASMKEATRSAVWPLAVACYGLGGGKMLIGNAHRTRISMVTKENFHVVDVCLDGDGDYLVRTNVGPTSKLNNSLLIQSKHLRYVVKALSKDSLHDVRRWTLKKLDEAMQHINKSVCHAVEWSYSGMETGRGTRDSKPSIELPLSITTALVRVIKGEMALTDLSPNIHAEIDKQYNKFTQARDKYRTVISEVRDFFSDDKWVIFNDVNGGMVVGGISKQPLLAAVEYFDNEGSGRNFPSIHSYNYVDVVEPFRWYRSFDAMPEAMRESIKMRLMMLKVHTNSEGLFPNPEANVSFYPSVGAYMSKEYSGSPVVMLSK